jgi:spore coat polysaccharide biosynthesis protein SpsF
MTTFGEPARVVAALACRVQSKRLYAKPLQLIGDKTILEHQLDQLRRAPQIDEIVLAISEGTENCPFLDIAKKHGLKYVLGDQRDVLHRLILAGRVGKATLVFRVTTECPYLYLDNIGELVDAHIKNDNDLTVCERLPEGTYFELINLKALERSHAEGDDRYRSEFCTRYIFDHPEWFKIGKHTPPTPLQRPDIRLTVDYPEDLIVMRNIYDALKATTPIPIRSIIEFLDRHPEIKAINSQVDATGGRIWA